MKLIPSFSHCHSGFVLYFNRDPNFILSNKNLQKIIHFSCCQEQKYSVNKISICFVPLCFVHYKNEWHRSYLTIKGNTLKIHETQNEFVIFVNVLSSQCFQEKRLAISWIGQARHGWLKLQ